jgi:DNA-binding winged helix-turn-helix (wHTH) protein
MTRHDEFEIAGWHVDSSTCQISQGEEVHKLEPKVMDLLVYMAGRSGEVLSRDELLDGVWHDAVVGYEALTNAVIKLRKAFGDDARHPRVIETYPKKGYRLIAEVEITQADRSDSVSRTIIASQKSRSSIGVPWYLAVVLAVLLLAGLFVWQSSEDAAAWSPPGTTVVAVLPFVNTGNDIEHSYFR